jgi:hypothetical protein
MDDGTGLAEALLGLAGFRVLAVAETPAEVVVEIETIAGVEGCAGCGVRAEAQDRMHVEIRDLSCLGRPARLVGASAGGVAGRRFVPRSRGPRPPSTSRRGRC